MTIEEKAKAYDEALERAKAYHRNELAGTRQEMTEYIFPELCESEDEEIYREIYSIVHHSYQERIDNLVSPKRKKEQLDKWGKAKAWLEKQKEQKPEVTHGETYHVDTLGTQQVIAGKMPQKPEEWSEDDEKNLGQVISGRYLPLGLREWFCGLPERFPSRSSWKPSEEQMEALMLAIEGKCPPTSYMSRRLEDLYDGLANTYRIDAKLD